MRRQHYSRKSNSAHERVEAAGKAELVSGHDDTNSTQKNNKSQPSSNIICPHERSRSRQEHRKQPRDTVEDLSPRRCPALSCVFVPLLRTQTNRISSPTPLSQTRVYDSSCWLPDHCFVGWPDWWRSEYCLKISLSNFFFLLLLLLLLLRLDWSFVLPSFPSQVIGSSLLTHYFQQPRNSSAFSFFPT